jgi:hypothetical protein
LENIVSNSISLAKEHLLKGLRDAEQEVRRYKKLLATFEADERQSWPDLDDLPPVRSEEYKGKRAMDALESYLRVRRGFKIPLALAAADLVEGGCDPGAPRGKKVDPAALVAHTLKIGVPNRLDVFDFEPKLLRKTKTGRERFIIPPKTPDENIKFLLSASADRAKRRKR